MKASNGASKGFPAAGVAFLRDLAENNNREWFAPRLELYQKQVRDPMLELIRALHLAMLRFAPAYVGEPAKCLYRVYRDTRFSKDKTPYKIHAAASFRRNSMDKNSGAGFYFAISPTEVVVGGGIYMPSPASLLTVRKHIADREKEFRATFGTKAVRNLMGDLQGEQAVRVPKGFPADHPAADLLRKRQYILYRTLPPELASSPRLFREIGARFETMTPFLEFLNKPLSKR